jgi:serine/threonine protein kinase
MELTEYMASPLHGGSLPPYIAAHIAKQLLQALDFLKQLQMVHSDVKPENILLASNPKRCHCMQRRGRDSTAQRQHKDSTRGMQHAAFFFTRLCCFQLRSAACQIDRLQFQQPRRRGTLPLHPSALHTPYRTCSHRLVRRLDSTGALRSFSAHATAVQSMYGLVDVSSQKCSQVHVLACSQLTVSGRVFSLPLFRHTSVCGPQRGASIGHDNGGPLNPSD